MPDLSGTATHHNLSKALVRESAASARYLWFARQADIEGLPEIAALFRSVADAETGHAHGHLEYLADIGDPASGEPLGDTAQNLAASIASEAHENDEMYPGFAETARAEGFPEIAEWFRTLARAEERHAERFRLGLDGISG